jgi:23S rRNA G2445 N2-methylase RlmL
VKYFATALVGFGPIVRLEVQQRGFRARHALRFDGRNDIVSFAGDDLARALALRTTEDVFAEVVSVRGQLPLAVLVERLAKAPLDEALRAHGRVRSSSRRSTTFRVVARVLSEAAFRRTELRNALARALARTHPRWRLRDPAALEFWVLETRRGLVQFGVRLTTPAMRHRGGRPVERPGALRPSAAAALCLLAGPPRGKLLDPLCGSGTILAEAAAAGWKISGGDSDPRGAAAARANVGSRGDVSVWDARDLPLQDASIDAVVSNLPFGRRFGVSGESTTWAQAVVGECRRVARPGAPLVLLAPKRLLARTIDVRADVALEATHDVRVLGQAATIWVLRAA